jgi:exodeoxyribonuclease VII large subunit
MNGAFTVLTVTQLNTYAKSLLEGDNNLRHVFLRAEISNFTNHYRSGHLYMSLKDDASLIKAVMFRSSAQRLAFMPQDGMKVIVSGRVSIYERDGQFQFYIDDMQPDGVGALQIAFEQLKNKLRAEGLFDTSHKKKLPAYPKRIGVVTSPTGAALQDIINITSRRWPLAKLILYPVLVQGAGAPPQICGAIDFLNAGHECDVIILGRGGGSTEELWAFNDEAVARAIYASAIPVVSAVGHETDFTIADFAADLRAPTPSAAAELVTPDWHNVAEYIDSLFNGAYVSITDKTSALRKRISDASSSAALRSPQWLVIPQRSRLAQLGSRLASAETGRYSAARTSFSYLAGRLDALSPLKVLSRGYAMAADADGNLISSAGNLKKDTRFVLKLKDGSADCVSLGARDAEIAPDGSNENEKDR